ncbi:C-myc promoter-binding protein-like [Haliotis cracherodii]|uniref:C-myc promoter-binding protein-like n=1 Tax=Haliotis cracherodii TaxID=6455 RepID=UPI0039E9FCFD
MDEKRVVDYFVVAGLPSNPLPLEEFTNEAAIKPSFKQDPITEIAVINRSLGEKIPKGFSCIERTPSGFPADLNHGSIRCPEMFLCYRRSREKPPLTDLGVLYEGKEKVLQGCEVVHTTAFGHPANVNNSSNNRTYITFRRASNAASSDTLAVMDICVILINKGEDPPLAFNRINKNLNKGMVGSDVFLCYKKAMNKVDLLAYKPGIIDRYPMYDQDTYQLPEQVPMFCLPMGATIECWPANAQHPLPVFSTFILTIPNGEKDDQMDTICKVFGAAVTFYEEYHEDKLSDLQMRHLGLKNKHIREQYRILKTVHANKSICLLSRWPFFDAFKKFLSYLYKISITGPHTVPIERHISHFMYDVPYPSPQRPRILVQLNHEALSLCMPEDSPLPQSGASFITLLKNMGPENCMSILGYILLEHKILIHSLRPAVLTGVAEAVSTMIFPFHWQCPYIPLCPLGLSEVLSAPCPFIVGIDSRYFDLYDPPSDVICVDLDTNRIWMPEDRKTLNYKLLPKKAARVLLETLHSLFDVITLHPDQAHTTDEVSLEMAPIDHDFKWKKKEMQMELQIQEAFLRFMACLLKDYKNYLNPILNKPTLSATDASCLFDMQNFQKSRDKAYAKFFHQMMKTQMFFRFIEERSFVSDKDASLTFFDECAEKVVETSGDPKLIEIESSHTSERTVFIMPPEPVGLPEGVKYSYNGFPALKPELFLTKKPSTLSLPGKQSLCPNSPLARRTKQEIRSAQKIAQQHITNPHRWAKCLAANCYSLWFINLPAFVTINQSKEESFRIAFAVLRKMGQSKLISPDEVCYRILMQLCGQYNEPFLAIKVFLAMKKHGVQPNAITYGYYNKLILEAKWPTHINKGRLLWTKIRNVIIGVAQFRRAIRRRSLSICSNSGSEFDQISRTSVDSYFQEEVLQDPSTKSEIVVSDGANGNGDTAAVVKANIEERLSTGGVSDRGYNSMTQEDVKRLSRILSSVDETDTSTKTKLEPERRKSEGRNPLRLSFRKKVVRTQSMTHGRGDASNSFTGDHQPRRRLGSIVRKSLGSRGSFGSFETLKDNILGNSAGLLMVSQSSLEQRALNREDLESIADKQRKRHKSAGEYQGKGRSNSLFASWRPRPLTGDGEVSMRFSELVLKDKASEVLKGDTPVFMGVKEEDVKDSGVELDENVQTGSDGEDSQTSKGSQAKSDPECNYSVPLTINVEMVNGCGEEATPTAPSPSPSQGTGTPVTENDPLGHFKDPNGAPEVSLINKKGDNSVTSPESRSFLCSTPFATIDENKRTSESEDLCSECNIGKSNGLDSDMPFNNVSAASGPVKKLSDVGRTSSSPDCLGEAERKVRTMPGKSQSVQEDPPINSSLSLNETPEKRSRPTDFVLRRTQSLRKTNEVIGGALRFAAKAAFSKFNELKQSITTPSKTGSNTSLAKSLEERDSGTGDDESGSTVHERRFGGSQDLLSRDSSSDSMNQKTQLSFGSAPSPSYMDKYTPMMQDISSDSLKSTSPLEKILAPPTNIAMEVEISSCSRCTRCHCLVYDEEIMAGWFADDSNLNTSCHFCPAKFVPHLQIYVKDWRGTGKCPVVKDTSNPMGDLTCSSDGHLKPPDSVERQLSSNSSLSSCDIPPMIGEGMELDGQLTPSPLTSPDNRADSPVEDAAPKRQLKSMSPSVKDPAFFDAAIEARRRTTSECLTHATDNTSFGSSLESVDGFTRQMRSPLSISIGEEEELPTLPSAVPEMKKDFMARSACSIPPIVVPYLSPLVLRKELEYVLEHEGDQGLMADTFVDEHPIIFWNLIWYFRRLEVPSHLPGLLLTAKTITKPSGGMKHDSLYDRRHVLIRPMWDNTRIHDEMGLPMYTAWNAGHRSTVVDALVTESQPFSRAQMHQIISSIQCNDVLSPIKLIMNNRRRHRQKKHQFRSLYREILFLAFIACGRENIDHDAFDREFSLAFDKLNPADVRRLQNDDKPRGEGVIWCRKVFGELEV